MGEFDRSLAKVLIHEGGYVTGLGRDYRSLTYPFLR